MDDPPEPDRKQRELMQGGGQTQKEMGKLHKGPTIKTMEILCPSLLFLNVRAGMSNDVDIMRTDKVTLAVVVVHL